MVWFLILVLILWYRPQWIRDAFSIFSPAREMTMEDIRRVTGKAPRRKRRRRNTGDAGAETELQQAIREHGEALREYNKVMRQLEAAEQAPCASVPVPPVGLLASPDDRYPTDVSESTPEAPDDRSGSSRKGTSKVTKVSRYSEVLAKRFQGMVWNYRKWDSQSWERPDAAVTSQREKLLRKSLNMVKNEAENGEVCQHIVETALENQIYPLACQTLRWFNDPDPDYRLSSIRLVFSEPDCWKHIDRPAMVHVARYLVRETRGYRSDYCDERSDALAAFGEYLFFTGQYEQACKVWSQAPDQNIIDLAIASTCKLIAQNEKERLDLAIELVGCIWDRKTQADTLTTLTSYLDMADQKGDATKLDRVSGERQSGSPGGK